MTRVIIPIIVMKYGRRGTNFYSNYSKLFIDRKYEMNIIKNNNSYNQIKSQYT